MIAALRISMGCVIAVASILSGCSKQATLVAPDPGLERMVEQPRIDPFGGDPSSPLDAGMRRPPDGTIARDAEPMRGERATGRRDDGWVERVPLTLDVVTLRRGQRRYAITCAVCHGSCGDGDSPVAAAMMVVKPRDLLHEPCRSYPIGRIFAVIRDGYGVMPSYSGMLDLDDSWAVAAYVQVLQLAQAVPASRLTPGQRRDLAGQLP